MAVQSPTSVQSQILDIDEANSTSELVSQLPYLTQIPYKVPILKDNPSIANTGSEQRSDILDDLRHAAVAQFDGSSQLNTQSDAANPTHHHEKPTDSDEDEDLILNASHDHSKNLQNTKDQVMGRNTLPSSNESLDCRPVLIPQDGRQTTRSRNPIDEHISLPHELHDSQPFLLYDRIRSMRADTRREGQLLSAKWVRSISKTQKKILDSDDAWNPPLPGRPYRQGTIPIDILNLFTIRADSEAKEKEQQVEKMNDKELYLECDIHLNVTTNTLPPSSPPPPPPPPPAADPPLDESENSSETRAASEWSLSSPPQPKRSDLPPDTSPVRPRELDLLQKDLSFREESLENTTAYPQPQVEQDCLREIQTRQIKASHVTQTSLHDNHCAASLSRQESTFENPNGELENLPENRGAIEHKEDQTTISEKQAETELRKVQVKHTPYPLKGGLAMKKQPIVISDIPQSSFVPATFPNIAALQRSDGVLAQTSEIRAHPSKGHSSSQPSVSSDHPSQSNLQQSRIPVPHRAEGMPTSVREPSTQLANAGKRSPDATSLSGAVISHSATSLASSGTRKRSRDQEDRHKSQSIPYTDPAYEEHDRFRKRQRQEFLQTHSKHKTGTNIERSFEGTSQSIVEHDENSLENRLKHFDKNGKLDNERSNINQSGKNASFHQSTTMATMSNTLDRTSGSSERSETTAASLFTKFKSSYPSYRGSEQSFRSALDLLLKLKADNPFFHPFLWDDFIYRFAHDYKAYLQACVEKDENALSYEVFYLSEAKRPECEKECVTARTLHSTLSSADLTMRRQSRSSSDLAMDMSRIRTTSITPEFVTNIAESKVPINMKATQIPPAASVQETPAVQRYQTLQTKPLSVKKRCLPPSWPSELGDQTPTTINSFQEKSALTAREVQDLTSTPEPSSKVERWRCSIRPQGGQSPELLREELSSRVRKESPELLPDEILSDREPHPDQLNDRAVETIPTRSAEFDSTKLRLPGYLTPNSTVRRSIEISNPTNKRIPTNQNWMPQNDSLIRKRLKKSDLPATLFTMFGRNYSNLAREQESKETWQGNKGSGINLYRW